MAETAAGKAVDGARTSRAQRAQRLQCTIDGDEPSSPAPRLLRCVVRASPPPCTKAPPAPLLPSTLHLDPTDQEGVQPAAQGGAQLAAPAVRAHPGGGRPAGCGAQRGCAGARPHTGSVWPAGLGAGRGQLRGGLRHAEHWPTSTACLALKFAWASALSFTQAKQRCQKGWVIDAKDLRVTPRVPGRDAKGGRRLGVRGCEPAGRQLEERVCRAVWERLGKGKAWGGEGGRLGAFMHGAACM